MVVLGRWDIFYERGTPVGHPHERNTREETGNPEPNLSAVLHVGGNPTSQTRNQQPKFRNQKSETYTTKQVEASEVFNEHWDELRETVSPNSKFTSSSLLFLSLELSDTKVCEP